MSECEPTVSSLFQQANVIERLAQLDLDSLRRLQDRLEDVGSIVRAALRAQLQRQRRQVKAALAGESD